MADANAVFIAATIGISIVLILAGLRRRGSPDPHDTDLVAGPPGQATGGLWEVADPERCIAEPNRVHVFTVSYIPEATFEATAIQAALRAIETYWVWETRSNGKTTTRVRVRKHETVREIPAPISGSLSFRAGERVSWDLAFDLDGLVPATAGDPKTLACEWQLAVSIDRPWHANPSLVQRVIVTEPRDRLNSGIVPEGEFSRYEEVQATDDDSGLLASFRVRPTPTDLAAPALVDVGLTNSRGPIHARGIRLELVSRLRVTDHDGDKGEVMLWQEVRPITEIATGDTGLAFQLPPLNRTLADADLKHGTIRGDLRLVVDRPAARDIRLARDLCLCLEPPA